MAWNEPGGDKDPWSGGNGDQGPPDLDEVVKNMQERLGGLFGGRKGSDGSGNGGDDGMPSGPAAAGMGGMLLLALVLFLAWQSFYIIEPAERGVVLRFGAFHEVTKPGPHLLFPMVDKVIPVDIDKVHTITHTALMLTQDENIVDLTLTVQSKIQDPADYKFQDWNPDQTLKDATETALREVIGKSKLDTIITENRSGIADSVKLGIQDLMDLYKTGMEVVSVNIQDANPPEQVKAAFDDANKAREDKVRIENQAQAYANDIVPRARGAGARQIEDAKAYKEQVIAEAEGETSRFLAVLKEYRKAPEVTRKRLYLETVEDVLGKSNKVMLDVKSGNSLMYLPLDRLMQQSSDKQSATIKLVPQTVEEQEATPRERKVDRSRRTR
jgi:membrane protease subunit HflK